MQLDGAAAHLAVSGLADAAGLGVEEAAEGILEVVDHHMQRALRAVSIEEGADPRQSVLVAFGGAGGLHASRLASSMGIGTVLIPPLSGVFSALGLLLAAPRSDRVRTVLLAEENPSLGSEVESLLSDARTAYRVDAGSEPASESVSAEVRYVGQSHELAVQAVPNWEELRASFETAHQAKFGFVRESQPIELVNLLAEVVGEAPLNWNDLPELSTNQVPQLKTTNLWRSGSERDVDLWNRKTLPAGFECTGPALIVDDNSVVRLEVEDGLGVHNDGTLEIHGGSV
jgi:N-methylhydantoinase A